MIRRFEEIGKDDIMTAGGKGANLGETTKAGLNVPPGFVVTADAYRSYLGENHIDGEIATLLTDAGTDERKLIVDKVRGLNLSRTGKFPAIFEAMASVAGDSSADSWVGQLRNRNGGR